MNIILILAGLNIITLGFLMYEIVKLKKRETYAVITNKYGESVDVFKINPSYDRIKHKYEGKNFSYIVDKDIPPLKFNNKRLMFWEFEKPEQNHFLKDFTPIMTASTLDILLEMEKIKALNKATSNTLEGLFTKKNIFIGLIIIGAVIVLTQGGFI